MNLIGTKSPNISQSRISNNSNATKTTNNNEKIVLAMKGLMENYANYPDIDALMSLSQEYCSTGYHGSIDYTLLHII